MYVCMYVAASKKQGDPNTEDPSIDPKIQQSSI